MKLQVFSLIALGGLISLGGCSTVNQVTKLIPEHAIVKHSQSEDSESRFANLYEKKPEYPVTCEKGCYAPVTDIRCSAEMENCKYIGQQSPPQLNTGFNVTWFGHASFKIETSDGQSFLFDPVVDQFDWPVDWAFRLSEGFFRKPPTGMTADSLTNPTAVMYSHIHYDHFHKGDIEALGNKVDYLTPLGFADHFPNDGYKITEMAWYAQKDFGETQVHFTPAHHFSSRIWVPFLYEDNDKSLWGSWLLKYKGKSLYFAGDTGYSKHFKDINDKYGDIDVCLLPIASYHHDEHANWYRYVHTTPEDALVAANDLNCKVVIPWGYGNATWKMGDKTSHSALFRLLNMKQQMPQTPPLYILNEGDSIAL